MKSFLRGVAMACAIVAVAGCARTLEADSTAPSTAPAVGTTSVVVTNAKEFEAALKLATPGTTITLRDGIWDGVHLKVDGAKTINGKGGTATAPIIVRPQTLGGARFTGASRLDIGGEWMVVDGLAFDGVTNGKSNLVNFRGGDDVGARNCRLTNFSMKACNPPEELTDYKWVNLYGQQNRVDHCSFEGMNHKGVLLVVWLPEDKSSNYHVIANNYFGPRPRGSESNGFETIRIGDSKTSMQNSRTLVENNLFEACNGEIEIISNKSCENTYRNNLFLRCEATFTLRHGNRCVVDGNWFIGGLNDNAGGVRVFGDDHVVTNNYFEGLNGVEFQSTITLMNGQRDPELNGQWVARNTVVAHNTVVKCRVPLLLGAYYARPDNPLVLKPENTLVANNILVSQGGPVVTPFSGQTIAATYKNNIVWGGEVGVPADAGLMAVDPKLVQSTPSDMFRPGADSPAIGAAEGLTLPLPTDIEGQIRPVDGIDVGADQSSTSTPGRRRPARDNVGPRWPTVPVDMTKAWMEP